jgi:hypothetical protein
MSFLLASYSLFIVHLAHLFIFIVVANMFSHRQSPIAAKRKKATTKKKQRKKKKEKRKTSESHNDSRQCQVAMNMRRVRRSTQYTIYMQRHSTETPTLPT